MRKTVTLLDGAVFPAIGQGTWLTGEKPEKRAGEIAALREGIELGMTLIDTAEMYGDGAAETLLREAIAPYDREKLTLVSKVYPWNAGRDKIFKSCEDSLRRLGTEYLDLYLLHWKGNVPFCETADCMQELVHRGKIRRWGVSNLDTPDLQSIWALEGGHDCVTNQILYHLGSRGPEFDLFPWMEAHKIAKMLYCPLAHDAQMRSSMVGNPILRQIAEKNSLSPVQLLLAFAMRLPDTICIPRSSTAEHVRQNWQAANATISQADLALLDEAFPPPSEKTKLAVL